MLLIFDTLYSRKKKEAKSAYKTKKFIKLVIVGSSMKQETVTISKKEYKELLEEVGILRNSKMMEAVKESDEAKKRGVKTWELKL